MIDWITAKIPCIHEPIRSGQLMKISRSGEVEWESPCLSSVTGSFDSRISVKSLSSDGIGNAEILHVSGNFAKFLQGHNIVGSDDLIRLVCLGLRHLSHQMDNDQLSESSFSKSIDWSKVNSGDYDIDRIDINFMYDLPSRSDVNMWLRGAEYNSSTRHGRPRLDGGTVYWGKNSRRWSIKAYSKAKEIEASGMHKLPIDKNGDFLLLKNWVQNKLRVEVVLRQLELRNTDITHAYDLNKPDKIVNLYAKYLKRMNMSESIILNDNQALKLPPSVRQTYHTWNLGLSPSDILPKATFYRHRKILKEFGIDISDPSPCARTTNVTPMIRVLEATPAQIPDWVYKKRLIA